MNNSLITHEQHEQHAQLIARIDQLAAQLATLHASHARAACTARRYKTIGFICAVSAAGLAGLAATQAARTPDVIRSRRFEVVDQNDKVVLLAGIGANGGQIDVWANNGTNVVRLGSNSDGGDLAVWNSAGHGVAGLYATSQGGRIEAVMPDGSGSAVLRAEGSGPSLAIADGEGRPRIAATISGTSAGISVRSAAGQELVALGAVEGDGGIMRVSQFDGTVAAQVMALPTGGSIGCATRGGSRAALIESSSAESGGTLTLFTPDGSEAIQATAHTEVGARLAIFGSNKGPVAVIEATPDNTAIIAFLQNGARVAGLGSSATGGLLNLAKPDGKAVIVAGAASDADGGAISMRSGSGSQLVRIGVDRIGAGEVAVYDGPGTRKRVLSAIATTP
ncbi:MAG: hypothetical protein EXS17_06190 [Phycisphaerales bacterium]|nr:hypothetical protein [Phycisphaerales bacterium]